LKEEFGILSLFTYVKPKLVTLLMVSLPLFRGLAMISAAEKQPAAYWQH
jgi:hypothetical protein